MSQPQAATAASKNRGRQYETIYVLRPDADVETAKKVSDRVQDVVGKAKGKLTLVESWGRRRLAYPVQKHTRGVYIYLKYAGGGDLVRELERQLKMLEPVLKFQTVKLDGDVDTKELEVDPEDVKFEPVAPMDESDVDESFERALGLEQSYSPRPSAEDRTGPAQAKEGEAGSKADDGKADAGKAADDGKAADAAKAADVAKAADAEPKKEAAPAEGAAKPEAAAGDKPAEEKAEEKGE